MSPSPDITETINLVVTIASLGLLGSVLSLAYVVERSGVVALRWMLQLVLAAVLVGAGLAGLGLRLSEGLVDESSMRDALEMVQDGSGADASAEPTSPEDGTSMDRAAEASESVAEAAAAFGPAMARIGSWMLGLAVLGLLLLLEPLRRLLARLVPIDPKRLVHLVALELALLLVLISAATGILVEVALSNPAAFPLDELGDATNLPGLWAQAIGFVLIAVLGVGFGVARGGRETLERLGLTRGFSVRWWIGVTLAGLLAGFAVDQLWQFVSPETLQDVETLTDALFGGLIQTGIPGALTIGLSAGIGEELLFRGAAQPRFGIVLTSLLFAVIHTQYSVSPALLQIFIIGYLLGLTRQRAGTLTAIGAHASYNFILALISMCDEGVLSCPW